LAVRAAALLHVVSVVVDVAVVDVVCVAVLEVHLQDIWDMSF
jgi:hypothetical protein